LAMSPSMRWGRPPSSYDGPLLVLPRGDPRLVPLGGPPGRDLHAPADAVQQQIQPGQCVLDPEPAAHDLADAGQRPALVTPAARGRTGFQHRLQSTQSAGVDLAGAPPGTLETSTRRPPEAKARRHRFADIHVTRNRQATTRSLAPAPIKSAAASRTCSRRSRSSAVSPPPSGYLTLRHSAAHTSRHDPMQPQPLKISRPTYPATSATATSRSESPPPYRSARNR